MANLKADSPLSRRIVLSFLQFLNSVEPASVGDGESLEVAKDCLSEVFKIDLSSVCNASKSDSLVEIFSSRTIDRHENKSDQIREEFQTDAPSTSFSDNTGDTETPGASRCLGDNGKQDAETLVAQEDELFGQFFGALEKVRYFGSTSAGDDEQFHLDRTTHMFHNARMEMQKSGCEELDKKNLAETFKSQGNKAMQSKIYSEAVELYTFAIALCDDNAVYYCNRYLYGFYGWITKGNEHDTVLVVVERLTRAAAYTQTNKYTEAIHDCHKSIAIDPKYSKAYSRLGFAYYAQENYRDAIDKGFVKALELDPNNESVRRNIQVAEEKLKEGQQRAEQNQNSSSSTNSVPPFTSMPFNMNGGDMASMLRNMATNVFQARSEGGVGGNINVNLGEQMPEEVFGTIRSVMQQMFSDGTSTSTSTSTSSDVNNSQHNFNGGSAPT